VNIFARRSRSSSHAHAAKTAATVPKNGEPLLLVATQPSSTTMPVATTIFAPASASGPKRW